MANDDDEFGARTRACYGVCVFDDFLESARRAPVRAYGDIERVTRDIRHSTFDILVDEGRVKT